MNQTIEQIKGEIESGKLVALKLVDNKMVGTEVLPYKGLYGEGVSLEKSEELREIYVYVDQSERISAMSDEELSQWCNWMRQSQNLAWDKPLMAKLVNQAISELKNRFGDDWRKESKKF